MKFEIIKINQKTVEIDKRLVFSVIFLFALVVLWILTLFVMDYLAIANLGEGTGWRWAKIEINRLIVIVFVSNLLAFIFGIFFKKFL